ncbi:MAG: hypothetical protein M3083_24940 [Actinomycetota bacterium]|nr:hypothetical protein [Actinomycetota bacterium]MDQ6949855.1 hypothetical protein [Actinomycetota bacterium]
MGLRERIEREVRAALKQAAAQGGQVNVARRVNKVIVRNVGGGTAQASAEQTAPIVQGPGPSNDDGADP